MNVFEHENSSSALANARTRYNSTALLVFISLLCLHGIRPCLKKLDPCLDGLLALCVSEPRRFVFKRLGSPIRWIVAWLECRILSDRSVSVPVDLLYVLEAYTIGKIFRELFFEPANGCQAACLAATLNHTVPRLPPRDAPCILPHAHQKYISLVPQHPTPYSPNRNLGSVCRSEE